MATDLYPISPDIKDKSFLKPSKKFRESAIGVIISIIVFSLFYLLLLSASITLLLACLWLGIMILSVKLSFLTIAAGLGIIGLGVMLFIFCIKFVFSKSVEENPERVEISEKEFPKLFEFIRQVNVETQTKFPKKIFLSPDVNARVFYNSSFWSMFFPVRKNLEIGLGLVNTLNISEFKGVLAHEFGHFSQKSMKLGSYIYVVNKSIFNLVYEKDNWDNVLAEWIQGGGIFGFYARLTYWIAQGLRTLLSSAYNLINIYYSKLSKEMEFHADAVAVSLAGVASFKQALRKISFSDAAYNYTLENLKDLSSTNKASKNLFSNHSFMLQILAERNKIEWKNGSINITDELLTKSTSLSRIFVENQWATHPSLEEREANFKEVETICIPVENSAWDLFDSKEQIQEKLTKIIYTIGLPETELESINEAEFETYIKEEFEKNTSPEEYNGFYDDRKLFEFKVDELIKEEVTDYSFDSIYSKENAEKIKQFYSNKEDLEILYQIRNKENKIRFFEFDNQKYKRNQIAPIIQSLRDEIKKQEILVNNLDKKAFQLNYSIALKSDKANDLIDLYTELFANQKLFNHLNDLVYKVNNFIFSLTNTFITEEYQAKIFVTEFSKLERDFKTILEKQDSDLLIEMIQDEKIAHSLRAYKENNHFFSQITDFNEEGFKQFSSLLSEAHNSCVIAYDKSFKKLMHYQLELFSEKA
ncbi:M48 family metallopeptidase [Chondrinema litorale]|uniref:M48 family metallopeptidase n=1 Tax=Chondrinema litorale TaxID=2994555 RepID=UPI002542D6A7|nr:M48 family metallopeptidase [Chondrinema litorale]UZR99145.1 M48 family metalloprotease [Chondrinema litorale]